MGVVTRKEEYEAWRADAKHRAGNERLSYWNWSNVMVLGTTGILWWMDIPKPTLHVYALAVLVISGLISYVMDWLSVRLSFIEWRLEALQEKLENQ